MRTRWTRAVFAAGALASAGGCGGRADIWEQPIADGATVQGLAGAIAIVDEPAHRVVLVWAGEGQKIGTASVPVGHGVVTTAASRDGDKLFVLSMGDQPRTKPSDETPSLTVVNVSSPSAPMRYELPDVLTSIAIDPKPQQNRIILFAGSSMQGNFIKNPNELYIVDTDKPYASDNPTARTLPSLLGGYPARLTFAPDMKVIPDNATNAPSPRELLIVESDKDVMLVDLDHPDRGEVTIPVSALSSAPLPPLAVAFDQGGGGRDPSIAVRSTTDNVYLFSLKGQSGSGGNDFVPIVNTIAVGGVPTDFAFVRTKDLLHPDQGARLAVLIPRPNAQAALINEADNVVLSGSAVEPYGNLSVASVAGSAYDQVLLYGGTNAGTSVALWDLSEAPQPGALTINPPRRITLEAAVQAVLDVPGTALKVFQTSQSAMYVFDLAAKTPSRLNTSTTVTTRIARSGQRAWAFVGGAAELDQIDLSGPHVHPVLIDRPISEVFEIERSGTSNALVVLHGVYASEGTTSAFGWRSFTWPSAMGLTVFDALAPDPMTARRYSSVLLEGLIP